MHGYYTVLPNDYPFPGNCLASAIAPDTPVFPSLVARALPFSHGNTVPQGALVIRQILSSHDGLLICIPGYTGSISALLETAFAWRSPPTFGTNGPTPLRDKIAAIMSVSDDRSDGATALSHLRRMLDERGWPYCQTALAVASDAFAHDSPRASSIATPVEHQVRSLVGALRLQRRGDEA